jgi:hypothetical protein
LGGHHEQLAGDLVDVGGRLEVLELAEEIGVGGLPGAVRLDRILESDKFMLGTCQPR